MSHTTFWQKCVINVPVDNLAIPICLLHNVQASLSNIPEETRFADTSAKAVTNKMSHTHQACVACNILGLSINATKSTWQYNAA